MKSARRLFVLRTGKPGKPKITFIDVQASYVRVKWAPPVDDGGSPVMDYRLIVDGAPRPNRPPVIGTETFIEQLTPGKNYTVILSARNVVGYGESDSWSFTTKSKGKVFLNNNNNNNNTLFTTQNYYMLQILYIL